MKNSLKKKLELAERQCLSLTLINKTIKTVLIILRRKVEMRWCNVGINQQRC